MIDPNSPLIKVVKQLWCCCNIKVQIFIIKNTNTDKQLLQCIFYTGFVRHVKRDQLHLTSYNVLVHRVADLGLERYDTSQLFVQLLTPTSFLVFIILHLHYFQKAFLQMSDINR